MTVFKTTNDGSSISQAKLIKHTCLGNEKLVTSQIGSLIQNNTKYILKIYFQNILTTRVRGEKPNGLRHCNQSWKVFGSNPTRPSAGIRDLTSLQHSK